MLKVCLLALRHSKSIIKYHLNLSKRIYSDINTSILHSNKYNTEYGVSYSNKNSIKTLFTGSDIPLKINSRLICTSCVMRKSRDKGEKKKSVKAQHIDLNESREVLDIDKYLAQMNRAIDELKDNYIKHLTLRSSAGSIERVSVNYDGEDYILQELVQIVYKPKMIVLNVTAFPQAIPQILKALVDSGMNLNPQQDGTTLFIPIPKVTKEYREGLAKNAKVIYVKCRDNIKDIRTKELKILKNKSSMSDDKIKRIHAQLEALSNEYIKKAENIFDDKQKELLRSSD